MFRYIRIGICVLALSGPSFAISDAMAQYLAGIQVLKNSRDLSTSDKAKHYRDLCDATGITAREAIRFAEGFKKRPEAWRKVQDKIEELLNLKEHIQEGEEK